MPQVTCWPSMSRAISNQVSNSLPARSIFMPTQRGLCVSTIHMRLSSDCGVSRHTSVAPAPVAGPSSHQAVCGLSTSHGTHSGKRSEEHTSELQSRGQLVCRLLLEKQKTEIITINARREDHA